MLVASEPFACARFDNLVRVCIQVSFHILRRAFSVDAQGAVSRTALVLRLFPLVGPPLVGPHGSIITHHFFACRLRIPYARIRVARRRLWRLRRDDGAARVRSVGAPLPPAPVGVQGGVVRSVRHHRRRVGLGGSAGRRRPRPDHLGLLRVASFVPVPAKRHRVGGVAPCVGTRDRSRRVRIGRRRGRAARTPRGLARLRGLARASRICWVIHAKVATRRSPSRV